MSSVTLSTQASLPVAQAVKTEGQEQASYFTDAKIKKIVSAGLCFAVAIGCGVAAVMSASPVSVIIGDTWVHGSPFITTVSISSLYYLLLGGAFSATAAGTVPVCLSVAEDNPDVRQYLTDNKIRKIALIALTTACFATSAIFAATVFATISVSSISAMFVGYSSLALSVGMCTMIFLIREENNLLLTHLLKRASVNESRKDFIQQQGSKIKTD